MASGVRYAAGVEFLHNSKTRDARDLQNSEREGMYIVARGFLTSVDPLHSVSNLFRSEQGVYMFSLLKL